ncbi:hypothetical protein [Aliikangiella sp. G2MR2-5]|uniref:hypothetical protein n=1 Tax=Aliikangiella sp. G2MR2-5 TaxID=2788943 RepID=UPI0018AB518E|nr:hypothetical protein [Aliikangiella sp. G2MR2-5]
MKISGLLNSAILFGIRHLPQITWMLELSVFRLYFLVTMCMLLTACSSMPFTSILRFSDFEHSDLLSIHGRDVRARISLDSPLKLELKNVQLALQFRYAGSRVDEYRFQLQPTSEKQVEMSHWVFSTRLVNQYTFRIDENSLAEFRKFQTEFLRRDKPAYYHWTVYYHLQEKSKSIDKAYLDLELKFKQKEAFFYLLKGAEIQIN